MKHLIPFVVVGVLLIFVVIPIALSQSGSSIPVHTPEQNVKNIEILSSASVGDIIENDDGSFVVVREAFSLNARRITIKSAVSMYSYDAPVKEIARTMKAIHRYGEEDWQKVAYKFLTGHPAPQAQTTTDVVPTFDSTNLTK